MIANELLTVIEFQRFLRFKKRQGYKKAKISLKTLFFYPSASAYYGNSLPLYLD